MRRAGAWGQDRTAGAAIDREGEQDRAATAEESRRRLSRRAPPAVPSPPAKPLDPTDRELIRATLRGDPRSFEALLERHGRVVWASVRRSIDDPEEARDVYQDAVVKAYERLGELRDPDRLRSWWLSIALNLGRERLRRGARREARDLGPERLADLSDGAAPAGAALERDEEVGRLAAALGELPARQREVCTLRLRDGLSHGEIAALLGITTDASRANYHQAVKRLRERLTDA